MTPCPANIADMSRNDLIALIDRCKLSERRFMMAYLRTKDPEYRRKLTLADRAIDAGRTIRMRATRGGQLRPTKSAA